MSPCLGPDEFVDLLDGQLPAARAAHVETCPTCRQQFAWLEGTLRDTRDTPVPEPSPLFWEHFAARVRTAIAAEPQAPNGGRWWQPPVLAPAMALVALVALLVITVGRVSPALVDPVLRLAADLRDAGAVAPTASLADLDLAETAAITVDAPGTPDAPVDTNVDAPPDVPLEVIASLVAGLDWDQLDEAGLDVQPGAADAAIDMLGPPEQAALVRALRAALNGPESVIAMRALPTCLVVACLSLLAPSPAAAQGAAGPALPEGAELRPAEVQKLFDAYLVMQAQQTLGLDDTQYPPFLTRLRELQETRRRNQLTRSQVLQDLARLAAPRAGTTAGDDEAITERLSALQEIESRNAAELRKAYRAVDELLTPLQQARFRLFEEQVERRKLELLMRARQTMRQQRRQQ